MPSLFDYVSITLDCQAACHSASCGRGHGARCMHALLWGAGAGAAPAAAKPVCAAGIPDLPIASSCDHRRSGLTEWPLQWWP